MSAPRGGAGAAGGRGRGSPPPGGPRPTEWLGVALRGATRLAGAAFALALLWPAAAAGLEGTGAAVLLAAPFLVTILAGVTYVRRGQRRVALLAAALLAVLAVGAWLGARGLGT